MRYAIITLTLIALMLLIGCSAKTVVENNNTGIQTKENDSLKQTVVQVDKENNMCGVDSDCVYAWYVEGCNTIEYIQKIASDSSKINKDATIRENVTCTCENNNCVTHG